MQDSYISFSGHYVTKDFEIKHCTLGLREYDEKHTGENLNNLLVELLEEWEFLDMHGKFRNLNLSFLKNSF